MNKIIGFVIFVVVVSSLYYGYTANNRNDGYKEKYESCANDKAALNKFLSRTASLLD